MDEVCPEGREMTKITKVMMLRSIGVGRWIRNNNETIQRIGRLNRLNWTTPRSDVATAAYNQIKKEESNEQEN